ncbi:potassium channel family protein [Haloferacaceae archaeon DSL9]
MSRWKRRTALYLGGLATVMVAYTFAYHYGMTTFEGENPSLLHSLQVVVEAFTTTGFGSDAPWESAEMNVLVILMDLTGVALIFLALPAFVFPLMEEILSTTVPDAVPESVRDHVVICTYTPRGETLIEELTALGVETVVVEPDRERATDLYENGYDVVHADPESADALHRAGLPRARALVADASDTVDASIVLAAKEVAEGVPVISVIENPELARYHRLAGAETVVSPRPLLGASLGNKATAAVSTDLGGAIEISEDFEIVELPVRHDSNLIGRTLAESTIREITGVNVIGIWERGRFQTPPQPSTRLDAETILLVSGRPDQIDRLKGLTLSTARRVTRGKALVIGFGRVGRAVCDRLAAAGVEYAVLDRTDMSGVDVVGDATDPDALREAGVETAESIVLTIPDDAEAEFATLVAGDANPDAELLARVEQTDSIPKMYRAGADYVLSLATVSGRMLASTIVETEEVISPETQVQVVRTTAKRLAGETLSEARVRERTGVTVVAVDRDGDVVTDVGPDFRIADGDALIVAGTDDGIIRFTELFVEESSEPTSP